MFARDTQIYLFSVMGGSLTAEVHARAKEAFHTYLAGIERGLTPHPMFLVGDDISLADICFVAEMALFSNERTFGALLAKYGLTPIYYDQLATEFPRAMTHFNMLGQHEAFAPEVVPYLQKIQARVSKGLSGIEGIIRIRIEQSISVVVSPLPLGEVGLSGPGEGSGGPARPRMNDGQSPSPAAETATSPASGRGDRWSDIRHLLFGHSLGAHCRRDSILNIQRGDPP